VDDNWALLYALETAAKGGAPVAIAFNLVMAQRGDAMRETRVMSELILGFASIYVRVIGIIAENTSMAGCQMLCIAVLTCLPFFFISSYLQVPAFLGAGARHWGFMLRGLRELAAKAEAKGIAFFMLQVSLTVICDADLKETSG
jgi:hypothetical protein